MIILIIGLILFLGIHSVAIVNPQLRERMAIKFGEKAWKAIYAAVALVGLVLIIKGYAMARMDPTLIYNPPFWLRHVTILLMLGVFPLLLAAYLPGKIQSTLKHPMLVATKLWALAHLLSNGMLADVVLFGAILAWAVIERISLKRRIPRPIPMAPANKFNDVIAVVGGLALYLIFLFWAHAWLFGVAPMAMR